MIYLVGSLQYTAFLKNLQPGSEREHRPCDPVDNMNEAHFPQSNVVDAAFAGSVVHSQHLTYGLVFFPAYIVLRTFLALCLSCILVRSSYFTRSSLTYDPQSANHMFFHHIQFSCLPNFLRSFLPSFMLSPVFHPSLLSSLTSLYSFFLLFTYVFTVHYPCLRASLLHFFTFGSVAQSDQVPLNGNKRYVRVPCVLCLHVYIPYCVPSFLPLRMFLPSCPSFLHINASLISLSSLHSWSFPFLPCIHYLLSSFCPPLTNVYAFLPSFLHTKSPLRSLSSLHVWSNPFFTSFLFLSDRPSIRPFLPSYPPSYFFLTPLSSFLYIFLSSCIPCSLLSLTSYVSLFTSFIPSILHKLPNQLPSSAPTFIHSYVPYFLPSLHLSSLHKLTPLINCLPS